MITTLPPLFTSKPLVQEGQHLGDIELYVFKIKILLAVFLHLQKIIELQV